MQNNQKIILLSGKKQAGKNTACNFIISQYLLKYKNILCNINKDSGDLELNGVDLNSNGIKVYSFADPLKRFCIDVLGADEKSCYGTDEDKNKPIPHLLWENMPPDVVPYIEKDEIQLNSSYTSYKTVKIKEYKKGPITGRELMQSFGTDYCRRLYGDCWAMGTMNLIKREQYPLSLICDGRFPNEIEISKRFGAYAIRLNRNKFNDNHKSEIALDDYPKDKYDLWIDNSNLNVQEACDLLKPYISKLI